MELRSLSTKRPIYEISGLIVGVIAILVSVYIGLRAERSKAYSINYVAERALIATPGITSGQLQVTYAGNTVTRPHLFTLRIENVGEVPIVASDIDKPLLFTFDSARVLSAELGRRNPTDLDAEATHDSTHVTVKHRLLNPGDWFTLDILADGPPLWPRSSVRISGVNHPTKIIAPRENEPFRATIVSLPLPLQYGALTAATLLSFGAVIVGVIVFFTSFQSPILPTPFYLARWPSLFDVNLISWSAADLELSQTARAILGAIGGRPHPEWVNNPSTLSTIIRNRVEGKLLSALGTAPEPATEEIVAAMRTALPKLVARVVFAALPPDIDRAAEQRISSLQFNDQSLEAFLQRARSEVDEFLSTTKHEVLRRSIDKADILLAILIFVVGSLSTLVVLGSWRTFLDK
jgi:hypothetical protein